MSKTPLNLTRNQIAAIVGDNPRAVRAFELLIQQVNDILPADITTILSLIQETNIEAGSADAKAVAAADAINRLAVALEQLAARPPAAENNSTVTDYIDLRDAGWLPAYKTGRIWFGPTGTLEVAMGNGNITQQVGEEFFRYGKASSAISDTNLQLIYKTGVVGASGVITFAPAVAGISDPDQILGVATESIAKNAFGRITTMGVVHGINTTGSAYGETWADNDDIWYNPVTGGLTKTKPVAPNIKVQVGTIINAGGGGSGSFSVKIGSSSSLGGTDSNVQLATLANGDLLQYDSTAGYWKNVTVASVISSANGSPVAKTTDFTVAAGETWLINNKSGSSCTVTLPVAASNTGRVLHFLNYQAQTLVSASNNVVPLAGGAATSAILEAVAGANATLVCNGTNWVMTKYDSNNAMQLE